MTSEIQVGDFVKGSYKFGCIQGVVTTVKKEVIVIKKCSPHYNTFTQTNELVNVTRKRIYQVGLEENETII